LHESARQTAFEREEFVLIYVRCGVDRELAQKVADQLMAKDSHGAHAQDEFGLSEVSTAPRSRLP
jgi:vacuolar iron transporter family protein